MTLGKPAYCHLPFLWPLGGAVALHWGPDVPIDLCRKTKSFKEIHLRHFTYYLEGIILFPLLKKGGIWSASEHSILTDSPFIFALHILPQSSLWVH